MITRTAPIQNGRLRDVCPKCHRQFTSVDLEFRGPRTIVAVFWHPPKVCKAWYVDRSQVRARAPSRKSKAR